MTDSRFSYPGHLFSNSRNLDTSILGKQKILKTAHNDYYVVILLLGGHFTNCAVFAQSTTIISLQIISIL